MKEFLTRFNLSLIIFSYSCMTIALYAQLNIFVVLLGLGCAVWRIGHYYGQLILLPKWVISIVAIASSVITVWLISPLGLFNTMLHLIFLGFSLKFLELKSVRDVTFLVNTGLVLIAVYLIFNSSIVTTMVASLLMCLNLSILLSLHAQSLLKITFIKILLKSCLLSIPLAIVLFVVMPRLPSLWKMPLQNQATTGLSDTVSPGEIANLSRSSALAFRATFTENIPPESERYWRAMTLDYFDGKTWSQSVGLKAQESQAKQGTGLVFSGTQNIDINYAYELIVEPHYNYWLPVLDYTQTPQTMVSLSDYSLRSIKPIVTRKSYAISQVAKVKIKPLNVNDVKQLTQLPADGNEQTDAWIIDSLNKGLTKQEVLSKILEKFSSSFSYTLQPPLLDKAQIDDFLFNTHAGFCVHFASSYLYVARRLGIPARMVTGYLGGEWQASEGFLTVRQYDAHAWVEIWMNNHWQRVDPTSYVAPERVQSGLEAGLTDSSEFLADEYFSLQKYSSVKLLNSLRVRIAQLDYLWARYVLNFDNQKQIDLLQYWVSRLPWINISYALMFIMALILLLSMANIFKPWQSKKMLREDKVYLQLQLHYKKLGVVRETEHTVTQYCLQIAQLKPHNMTLCIHFAKNYNALKYQPVANKISDKKRIKQLIYISKQLQKH